MAAATDKLDRLEKLMETMATKLDHLDAKVNDLFEEYDDTETKPNDDRFIKDDEIYKYGQRDSL